MTANSMQLRDYRFLKGKEKKEVRVEVRERNQGEVTFWEVKRGPEAP